MKRMMALAMMLAAATAAHGHEMTDEEGVMIENHDHPPYVEPDTDDLGEIRAAKQGYCLNAYAGADATGCTADQHCEWSEQDEACHAVWID